MSYSFYALISRMKNIDRWALMRNADRENVMEHSYMVAVLAHALAVIRRDVFGGIISPEMCAAAALFHDAPEIFTGDMPTPVKYHDDEMISAYKRVEETAVNKLALSLPDKMRPEYEALLNDGGEVRDLVKAADKLSAYIKCIEELKTGNEEFRSAAESTLKKLKAMDMPEIDYFIDNFIPAFEMTLDEISI
jgi:5'-deoxynucleotidase